MKKLMKKFLIFIICVSMLALQAPYTSVVHAEDTEPIAGVYGSGSYQLNSVPSHYRFYTEYYVTAEGTRKDTTAGVKRRTSIQVYAKEGEVILFGSSVYNSYIDENNELQSTITGKDIVMTKPDNSKQCFDVLAPGEYDDVAGKDRIFGYGYIANPTQEKNGPMVNHTEETDAETNGYSDYYVPIKYEVPAGGEGIYTFEFHSMKGKNNGQTVKPVLASATDWDQKEVAVAAWDITVLGRNDEVLTKWEVKPGRAWTNYLALTTGEANDKKSDLNVHVLTHDGYVYKVNFKEAVPFGFIFFANNTGFMRSVNDEDGNEKYKVPIYHSFYDSSNDLDYMANENITLHKPNETDTATEETYKIFFNKPSSDIPSTVMKTKPDESVTLSDVKFYGISDTENIAVSGQGGLFKFNASGEATVSITLDLRRAIFDSGITKAEYDGSGIVEITAFAHTGDNAFYWDGKDTNGIVIPAGIYGHNDVVIASEVKRGELHFPVIDMEGLYGGLTVERISRLSAETDDVKFDSTKYDLYYNNNPLAYGSIEGGSPVAAGTYNILSDGTKSYNVSSSIGGWNFFKNYTGNISTLKKDDKEYLSHMLFNRSYSALSEAEKKIIDAEFGVEKDTYHFEPVNSNEISMKFSNGSTYGGGNQAGIDAWTYYSQGIDSRTISFAMLDGSNKGMVTGQIFYDANKDSEYNTESTAKDYGLPNVKVRLINSDGEPVTHEESLPVFDDSGHFVYKNDGTVLHETKMVDYETVTDSNGVYRFTGVPYDTSTGTTYYVQVLLTDAQTEVLRYTCTTSEWVKENLISTDSSATHFHNNTITASYGPDGNKMYKLPATDHSKFYGYMHSRDTQTNETIFDRNETTINVKNTQFVVLSSSSPIIDFVNVATFKSIGYCSAVPEANQWDYTVKKDWDEHTNKISDGLTIELWVWNDSAVKEENEDLGLSRRRGALIDTQVLNDANGWSYTWKNLDNRLQYYVLEYYTKKKSNGDIIYNDKGEPRMVLIGGTMPIFSYVPDDKKPVASGGIYSSGIYGFATNLGDYPEKIDYQKDSSSPVEKRILIQYFKENKDKALTDYLSHANSITDKEKLESVDNNARQYEVTYTLSYTEPVSPDVGGTNTITLSNRQLYDDRTYYVWLDHEASLPNMIGRTFLDSVHKLNSHAVPLMRDGEIGVGTGEYRIKGLSISSVDAAEAENKEGNATDAFRVKADGDTSAVFTATNHGNYLTGTGTRTYRVKYVTDSANDPVSVKVNSDGKLVTSSGGVAVEGNSAYIVYSWYMTIHVYDVKPDGVIEYDPASGDVNLQTALNNGTPLTWKLIHDSYNNNSVTYESDDPREGGILSNDIYRVPLYKNAVDPHMGTCADIVGIAYAEGTDPELIDGSTLIYEDTYESRYGVNAMADGGDDDDDGGSATDGIATAYGSGGCVTVTLNTPRNSHINRTQDHANYADVTFTPLMSKAKAAPGADIFFYKVMVLAEDSTYQFTSYDQIDASVGVVMYSYFVMKPKSVDPPKKGGEDPNKNTAGINIGKTSPKTGDDTNIVPWIILALIAVVMVVVGILVRGKNKIAFIVPCVLGGLVLAYAGYMLVPMLSSYWKAASVYDNAASEYVSVRQEKTEEENTALDNGNGWESMIDVDVTGLRSQNEDVVGWIYFENVDISYPVLHAQDDETYLRKAYTGEDLKSGSIFMEGINCSDFSDVHTIVYGHNMKDLSMFGRLKNYVTDMGYLSGHEYFQIVTEQEKYRYKIFSCKVVADDSDIYTVYHDGSQEFLDFLQEKVQADSMILGKAILDEDDHVITLSTCYGDDRIVISAKRVETMCI